MRYTVFLTYSFGAYSYSSTTSLGFGESIHCNYIQKIETDDIEQKDITFYFKNLNDFKFLYYDNDNRVYSVNNVYAIVQIVDNEQFPLGTVITPNHTKWKKIDVTSQITTNNPSIPVTAEELVSTVFKVSYSTYTTAPIYTLDYLLYPLSAESDNTKLSFGEEYYFLGNVTTDIEAIAYTTDISIVLGLGDYNSTTNPTWNGETDLYISEVGIYDDANNLVAIGKLNNPISKSSSIGRTIVFAIDF